MYPTSDQESCYLTVVCSLLNGFVPRELGELKTLRTVDLYLNALVGPMFYLFVNIFLSSESIKFYANIDFHNISYSICSSR